MKNQVKRKCPMIVLVVISFFLVSFSRMVEAAEDSVGFSFELRMPDNSLKPDAGYYDLLMTPGQKQTLEISFTNNTSKPLTVNASINGAKTNRNGLVEYGDSTIENDASLKNDFQSVVKGPEKITLKANETKDFQYTINMPKEKYDGVLVGGLQFVKEEDTEKAEGTQIVNRYAYVVPILLKETDVELTPDLAFNSVAATSENGRNSIVLNFSNVVATYVKEMTAEVNISKKGSQDILYTRKKNAMLMAPNSFMDYYVSLNGDPMVAGNYMAQILITSGNQKWEWQEDFKITEKEAKKFNEQDVNLTDEDDFNWTLVVIVIAVVIVFVALFLLINKKFMTTKKKAKPKKKKRK